jgi:sortase A
MRQILGAVGRVLVTVGLLVLLFVAYQLWGTGIYEARAQNRLENQFQEQQREHKERTSRTTTTTAPAVTTTSTLPPTTTLPPMQPPANGDPVAHLMIGKIGLDAYVVEGVDVADLRQGPGHYPGTPFPGQEGNTAIAGHRTTYGAPFGDLDQVGVGDEINLETVQGKFLYRVDQAPFVIDPSDSAVLNSHPDDARPGHDAATLTLTTCHPKYSAAERLIVTATLVKPTGQVPLPPTPPPTTDNARTPTPAISGLSGETSSRTPAILWGVFAAVVGALWWLAFHRHPSWVTWIVGVVPFLVVLFVFYTYFERVLPANY